MKRLSWCAVVFTASLFLVPAVPAQAQAYPTRPVRLVVGSAAGGGPDIVARIIAGKLAEALGQQVVVDNRAGAGTMIGTEVVARSAPDGYTLLMAGAALAINPAMYKKVPYDAIKDFAPITQAISLPFVLVVHPSKVKNRLSSDGAEPVGTTPEQFGAFLKSEVAKWTQVARAAGIKPE